MITEAQANVGTNVGRLDRHFRDEICRQDSLEAAAVVLADAAETLGWDLASFHANIESLDLPLAGNGEFIAERMGWPTACLEGWCRFKFALTCPIASQCARVTEPFSWTCDERDTQWFTGEFSANNRRVMSYYGRFVSSGVAVPVHRGACTSYVGWCSRRREDKDLDSIQLGSMFFISHVFINHVESLKSAQDRNRSSNELSERELECLTWVAHGKCEETIAQILHRSRATVHFHLQNAIRKLDAGNRTHAVAIACTRGLIRLR